LLAAGQGPAFAAAAAAGTPAGTISQATFCLGPAGIGWAFAGATAGMLLVQAASLLLLRR
jgi:hypothetical protein